MAHSVLINQMTREEVAPPYSTTLPMMATAFISSHFKDITSDPLVRPRY